MSLYSYEDLYASVVDSAKVRTAIAFVSMQASRTGVVADIETASCKALIVPLQQIEYGVDEDLVIIYPKPYSIYLRALKPQSPRPEDPKCLI